MDQEQRLAKANNESQSSIYYPAVSPIPPPASPLLKKTRRPSNSSGPESSLEYFAPKRHLDPQISSLGSRSSTTASPPRRAFGNNRGDRRWTKKERWQWKRPVDPDWPDEYELKERIGRIHGRYGDGCHSEVIYDIRNRQDTADNDWVITFGGVNHTGSSPERVGYFIHSKYLQKVVREVVDFDPLIDATSDPLLIESPYRPLYFNFEKIQSYIAQNNKADGPQDQRRNLFHLRVLEYSYLKGPGVQNAQIRSAIEVGEVSFDNVWALFKPGSLALAKNYLRQWQMFMCASVEKVFRDRRRGEDGKRGSYHWRIIGWSIVWDPAAVCFARRAWRLHLKFFVGTRRITTLSIVPLEYFGNDAEKKAIMENLKERGNMWRRLVSQKPSCWIYEGAALVRPDLRRDERRSILDDDSDFMAIGSTRTTTSPLNFKHEGRIILEQPNAFNFSDIFETVDGPGSDVGPVDDREEFTKYDDCSEDAVFDDMQAMLCPSAVTCFSLARQMWCLLTIEKLKALKWNKEAIKHLVLAEEKKRMLCELLVQHGKQQHPIVGDVIEGKGNGLVIVLHGPPGVGKTLTAESAAELIESPLRPISMADLTGQSELGQGNFEAHLSQLFEDASRWGAVLLLDEADVILEKRSLEDVKRNGIVSVFLRMLEYFEGILFMTTNRLHTMDVAFQSRIHVAIEYKSLNSVRRRQIWERFIEKLGDADSQEELLENMDFLKKLELNGRQIRNVLNLAQSLAQQGKSGGQGLGRIGIEHIRDAAEETLSFQQYFLDSKEGSRLKLRSNLPTQMKKWKDDDDDDDDS